MRRTISVSDLGESPPHVYAMVQAMGYKGAPFHPSLQPADIIPPAVLAFLPRNYTPRMGSPYLTSLPHVLPNLGPISMTGNHGAGFTPVANMNLLYSPTACLIPSVYPHHQMEPTAAPVNTHLHIDRPNASGSSAPDSIDYSR